MLGFLVQHIAFGGQHNCRRQAAQTTRFQRRSVGMQTLLRTRQVLRVAISAGLGLAGQSPVAIGIAQLASCSGPASDRSTPVRQSMSGTLRSRAIMRQRGGDIAAGVVAGNGDAFGINLQLPWRFPAARPKRHRHLRAQPGKGGSVPESRRTDRTATFACSAIKRAGTSASSSDAAAKTAAVEIQHGSQPELSFAPVLAFFRPGW